MDTKFCKKCRKDKPAKTFVTADNQPSNCCGSCLEKNRAYRQKWQKASQTGLICQKCGKAAPPEGFPVTRQNNPGKRCVTCVAKDKRYFSKHKDKIRARQKIYYQTPQAKELWAKNNKTKVEKLYGLFPGQKEILYASQDGKCAICQKYFPVLAVDHDHETGKIRSLLCKPCNLGLGNFKENQDSLRKAIDYLNYWHNWR